MSQSNPDTYVATVNVRDDFFNDPFFKDWWADFENPISVIDNTESGLHIYLYLKHVSSISLKF